MKYTGYELLWLFFIYSFVGWVIETIAATIKKKTFINKGLFSGPVCFVYGISATLMTIVFWELVDEPFFLFLGCTILGTTAEWVTGKLLERMNHQKWWDYSDKKFNFDGYICLSYSILWGILGMVAVMYGNDLLVSVFHLIPSILGKGIVLAMCAIGLMDFVTSMAVALRIHQEIPAVTQWNHALGKWTHKLRMFIVRHVRNRMIKAYPSIQEKKEEDEQAEKFAEGCGFYKLFWLFFIGSLIGDLVETIFMRITAGEWVSRSSLVWGPFSIVWGMAIVLATILLYRDKEKPDRYIFCVGTLMGGAYEYLCSVMGEIVFGKIFWDYSKLPFNLGGRVNLLYCLFWGIAAVLWIKVLYPKVSYLIEKVPKKFGKVVTWIAVVFMVVNMAVSALALIRYDARDAGKPAVYSWEQWMDEKFDDERMKVIYPYAKDR